MKLKNTLKIILAMKLSCDFMAQTQKGNIIQVKTDLVALAKHIAATNPENLASGKMAVAMRFRPYRPW